MAKLLNKFGYVNKTSRTAPLIGGAFGGLTFDDIVSQDRAFNPYFFYTHIPWVRKAVMAVADTMASIPGVIFLDGDEDEKQVDIDVIKNFLRAPNPQETFVRFTKNNVRNMLLDGSYYVEPVIQNGNFYAYSLKSSRIRVDEQNSTFDQIVYIFTAGGREIRFFVKTDPQTLDDFDLLHGMYEEHPTRDFVGLSPIRSAITDLKTQWRANVFNDAFLRNGAKTMGIINLKDPVDEKEFDRLSAKINDKYSGEHNAHKLLVLTNDWNFTPTSETPKDMDFLEMGRRNRENFLGLLGVPPIKAGILDNANYSNSREQKLGFWEDTILPLAVNIQADYTRMIKLLFQDPRLVFKFDLKNVKALREDENDRIDRAMKKLDRGVISINETRAEDGKDPVKGGEEPTIVLGRQPLSDTLFELEPTNGTGGKTTQSQATRTTQTQGGRF